MTNDFIGQIKQVFIFTELEITAGVSIQFYFIKNIYTMKSDSYLNKNEILFCTIIIINLIHRCIDR